MIPGESMLLLMVLEVDMKTNIARSYVVGLADKGSQENEWAR